MGLQFTCSSLMLAVISVVLGGYVLADENQSSAWIPRSRTWISTAPVLQLIVDFPDGSSFAAIDREGGECSVYAIPSEPIREVISLLPADFSHPIEDLPIGRLEDCKKVSMSRLAVVANQNGFTWDAPTQTARLLRHRPAFMEIAGITVNEPSKTITTFKRSGELSVWDGGTLELLRKTEIIPLDHLWFVNIISGNGVSYAGDVAGNVWLVSTSGENRLIRGSRFSTGYVDAKLLPADERLEEIRIVNSKEIVVVLVNREGCALEWITQCQNNDSVWNKTRSLQLKYDPTPTASQVSNDGKRLYFHNNDAVFLVDLESGGIINCFVIPHPPDLALTEITCCAISDDEKNILTGHRNGSVVLWVMNQ